MADQILIRGDTTQNLQRARPILRSREMMLEYDGRTINAKAGDGFTTYDKLEYIWYDITVNGVRIRPTDRGVADIFVPVNTSEIQNDGDGTSPFTTKKVLDAAVASLQKRMDDIDAFFKGEFELVRSDISRVEAIAKGASRAVVIDTEAHMRDWLAGTPIPAGSIFPEAATPDKLIVGDSILIIEIDVPDYWWAGNRVEPLETQKVDLTDYPKFAEVQAMMAAALRNLNASNLTSGTVPTARLPNASLTVSGITKLNNATNSNSESEAATPKAVSTLGGNVLQKNNTIPFEPTEAYHPATKKYVDDNAGAVVIDHLNSSDPTAALSANQGRLLNEKIGIGGTQILVGPESMEAGLLPGGILFVTGEPIKRLGDSSIGDIVKFQVDGVEREFIVVQKGTPSELYSDSFDDGVVLLMKDIYRGHEWHSSGVNDYENSTIHAYLNDEFFNFIDADIRSAVKDIKIPYRPGSGVSSIVSSGENGLPCKVFLLSTREVGITHEYSASTPDDGVKFEYFLFWGYEGSNERRIANLFGTPWFWHLRSPVTTLSHFTQRVLATGSVSNGNCVAELGVRPALVLPASLLVASDGTLETVSLGPLAKLQQENKALTELLDQVDVVLDEVNEGGDIDG